MLHKNGSALALPFLCNIVFLRKCYYKKYNPDLYLLLALFF